MTIYALGDYHGRSIKEFLEIEKPTSEDTILSTGDFDEVNVINEITGFEEESESSLIDVGGNHDHALIYEMPISSPTIEKGDKEFYQMMEELGKDPDAKEYLQKVVENPIKKFEIGDMTGVLVHGGLAGHIQSDNIDEEMKNFWYRLWEDEDFEANFDKMDEAGYDLMIRGHDHRKDHAFRPKKGFKPTYRSRNLQEPYKLDKSKNHIITHGAWYKGNYIAIDEEKLEIEFKSI